jgi:hypothetical protein
MSTHVNIQIKTFCTHSKIKAIPNTTHNAHNTHNAHALPPLSFITMSIPTSKACGPAPTEAIYTDLDTTFAAVQAHAKPNSYAFRKYSKKANRAVYCYDRDSKYDPRGKNPNADPGKQRLSTSSKKCGCKIAVELRRDHISGH